MAEDELVDTVVDRRYRVVRKLGEGGMCVVYEVQHLKLLRSFALKRLLPLLARNDEAVQRFELEAELLGGLRHPNIVDITDWVVLDDDTPCMVLEFLHGAELGVRLSRGQLPWDTIARVGDQAMSALTLAHRQGITHRDLKPENIFISIDDAGDERVKLLDFGVSKLRGAGRLSGMHKMLGTPSYMSPEQADGNTDLVGPSTDVWAMGAILYEMATQRVAFKGESIPQTLELITTATPVPIMKFRPDAPPAFVELVDRAISRDPTQRLDTIEELRGMLRAALEPKSPYRVNTPIGGTPVLQSPEVSGVRLLTPSKSPPMSARAGRPTSGQGSSAALAPAPKVASSSRRTWMIVAVIAILVTAVNVAIALAT